MKTKKQAVEQLYRMKDKAFARLMRDEDDPLNEARFSAFQRRIEPITRKLSRTSAYQEMRYQRVLKGLARLCGATDVLTT